MNLGWMEIVLIGGIALLVFGPSRLPNLGKSLGESIRGFKKGLNEDEQDHRDVSKQIPQNHETPVRTVSEETEEKKDPNSAT